MPNSPRPILFQHRFQKSTDYLNIQAGKIACAIALARVHKIVTLMALEYVPNAPNYLAGVFNYHGQVVPVIDLLLRIGEQPPASYDINSSVLLCETVEQEGLIGLIVSYVGDIVQVNYAELQLSPEFTGKQSPFLACYKKKLGVVFLLNSDVLLEHSVSDFNAVLPSDIQQAVQGYIPDE